MMVNQAAESAGTTYLLGTISTNKPACLNNAQMAGTLVNTSVEFIASGGGSATSATVIQFDGETSGNKVDGFLEVVSSVSECDLTRVAATLTRQ